MQPDVLTLDVEMPRMDGLAFLEKLMRARPMPVVMVSSLTEKGCQTAMRALELGAVDFVTKPKMDVTSGTVELGPEIIEKIKIAARAKLRTRQRPASPLRRRPPSNRAPCCKRRTKSFASAHRPAAPRRLYDVLTALPADAPGIAIVQHMPAGFTRSFAERLDGACQIRVKEARDGDRILQGHALLAPGGLHMAVTRIGANYTVRVAPGQPVNRHCPSVDVLFQSAARHVGQQRGGRHSHGDGQ